ncbi:unnamed protein product, partial [Mesorhabditis spiculigera]
MNRVGARLFALRRVFQQKRNGGGHGHAEVNPGPPVTYDYAPIPFQPYNKVIGELNTKFNVYLAIAATAFVASFAYALKSDLFIYEAAWRPPKSYRERK